MKIYYIRHAQSANNLLWHLYGPESNKIRDEDPELTETGHRQALKLAEYLKYGSPHDGQAINGDAGFEITHIYTSLMLRSVTTGDIIANTNGLPMIAMPELHEVGGIFTVDTVTGERVGGNGKNRHYFETHYPSLELPETVGNQGWWNKRPYETRDQSLSRAQAVLNVVLSKHQKSKDNIALISHGGFYQSFISAVFGIHLLLDSWLEMNNAALTRIDIDNDSRTLVFSNRTCHLPSNLITS